MPQIIKKVNEFIVSMKQGSSYFAVVHPKTAEWYCFDIRKEGTYQITCNGENDYTVVEKDPPPRADALSLST